MNKKFNDLKNKLVKKISFWFKEDDINQFRFIINDKTDDKNVESFMQQRVNKTLKHLIIGMSFYLILLFIDKCIFPEVTLMHEVFSLSLVLLVYCSFKLDYFKVKREFNKRRKEVYNSFPLWVSTLQILIMTNNVTNTFKKSIPTCPECIRYDLEEFVKNIEFDPENKEHYKSFLKKYKLEDVQEIIMDMYAFNKMDKNEIVYQFEVVNKRLNKIQNNIRVRRQQESLFVVSALNSLPLLAASLYILITSMLLSNVQ